MGIAHCADWFAPSDGGVSTHVRDGRRRDGRRRRRRRKACVGGADGDADGAGFLLHHQCDQLLQLPTVRQRGGVQCEWGRLLLCS